MIPITLFLVWLLVVLFSAGMLGYRLLAVIGGGPSLQRDPVGNFENTLWLGLVVFVTLGSALSLFHPLDLKWTVGPGIALIALAFLDRKILFSGFRPSRPDSGKWFLILVAAFWVIGFVFVASDQTSHYDTGLYHAQMVKWNKQFGVVPGLANLHSRLGYNSAWDIFGSLVDQSWFSGRAFHIVELVIGVIFLCACVRGFWQWSEGKRSLSTILRCFGLVVLLHDYRDVLPSLSNDWPISLLIYYAVILFAEQIESGSSNFAQPWKVGLLTAICFFAVSIKVSTGPILLLPMLLLVSSSNRKQILRLIPVIGILVMAPFVARNIILSGYVVYPVPSLDLFNFDWKVPRVDAQFQASMIKYWAINPGDDWYRAIDMNFRQQLRVWIEHRGSSMAAVIPWIATGLFSWLLAGVLAKNKNQLREFWCCNAIAAILLAGITFCFVTAPDPRFAEPWILAFSLFSLAWLARGVVQGREWNRKGWTLVGQTLLVGCTVWMVRHAGIKRLIRDPVDTLCRVNDLPPSSELKEVRTEEGLVVKTPVTMATDQTWNADLPNTPEFNRWLRARGPSLKDGFSVSKPFVAEWRP